MSYLFPPRIHFAGRFQADPSTVNNDAGHFDNRTFQASYDLPQTADSTNGQWNPRGTGAWRLIQCKVNRAAYSDGSFNPQDIVIEPLLNVAVRGADSRVEGKIVDLDPQQQNVSEIWGFQVVVGQPDSGCGFRADFEVTALADLWPAKVKSRADTTTGAFYQSVLHVTHWNTGSSRVLQELCTKGKPPKHLSIRFNVDAYDLNPQSVTFTTGRIVGSIGRYLPREPRHFVAGRALEPVDPSPLFTSYGKILGDTLFLDLGNSLPEILPDNPDKSLGSLYVAVLPANGAPVLVGVVPYQNQNWYTQTAGIVSFKLDAEQAAMVAKCPLAVVQLSPGGPVPLLKEPADGLFVRADRFVFRFNPPETRTVKFYASVFGAPAAGQKISLALDPSVLLAQRTAAGPENIGTPESALRFPSSLTTGKDGTVTMRLQSFDPKNPRHYLDGQVYYVTYAPGANAPAAGTVTNGNRALSALVFDPYVAPKEPTWLEDVQPIFQRYDNLFPVMRSIVELSNFASVYSRRGILRRVFAVEESDPNYMPVTRDLSKPKRAMIRTWLDQLTYMRLDSVEDLVQALQLAVELEHSTIPPYLCALYTIKAGANPEVAAILRDIVLQEMVHMAQVANLLISIGHAPKIYDPAFVPRFPGPVPGGLRGGLTVRLRRCSIAQIRDVFMSMEKPEETIPEGYTPEERIQKNPFTIGWFYDEIGKALRSLSRSRKLHFGNPENQVTDWPEPHTLVKITSLRGALAALRKVKLQGESAIPLNLTAAGDELGHYYRFSEIVEGRRLVVHPDKKTFSYTGGTIPFDPDGVWPMLDDPDLTSYPAGSRAARLAVQFARTYQTLLKGLDCAFNGHPERLQEALGLMFSLRVTARELVSTPSGRNDGTTAGPVFQWIGPAVS